MIRRLFKFIPSSHYILLSLLLFAGFEFTFILHFWLPFSFAVFLGLMFAGSFFIRLEEEKLESTHIILPALAALAFTGYALFFPTDTWSIHVYFAACSFIFFFLLKQGARRAYPTWNWALSMLIYFLSVSSVLALRFYFYFPILSIIVGVFIITFLIHWQASPRHRITRPEILILSLTMAFIFTQLAWVMQFLPLHHIAQSALLTTLYYTIFHLVFLSYERLLRIRDLVEYATVSILVTAIILGTTQWI